MRAEIARFGIRDARRALLGWTAGVGVLFAATTSAFPSIRESSAKFDELLDEYPDALKAFAGITDFDYSTGSGYLQGEVFGLMAPLLLLVLAIGRGANAIGGEEERGTLATLLALPVSRTRVVLERALAAGGVLGFVGVGTFASAAVFASAFGLGVALTRILAAVVLATLLAAAFGALALAAGAWTGHRGRAIAVASAAAFATYLLDSLAVLIAALERWRWLSPFAWYREADALDRGAFSLEALALVALTAGLVMAAVAGLGRRDVAGG